MGIHLLEPIRSALRALREHRLRSALTLLSMAIGVFAIVGVAGAVGILEGSLGEELVELGANDVLMEPLVTSDGYRPISVAQARSIRQRLRAVTGTVIAEAPDVSIRLRDSSTDRPVELKGVDENFLLFEGRSIAFGRNFVAADISSGASVALIGSDVADRLGVTEDDLGSLVRIGSQSYRLIGVLVSEGSSMGEPLDEIALIPLSRADLHRMGRPSDATVVFRSTPDSMASVIDRAIGVARAIRRLDVYAANDFRIVTLQEFEENLSTFTTFIVFFGFFCGAVALLAAGIGVMNIMLVSVQERRREIGVRRAVGAAQSDILVQFLVESLMVCQIGAVIGVTAGLAVAAALAAILEATFVLPIGGLVVAVSLCIAIGIAFGTWPAYRASLLDPIESLRYE